jgi:hypothetical protein
VPLPPEAAFGQPFFWFIADLRGWLARCPGSGISFARAVMPATATMFLADGGHADDPARAGTDDL